MALIKDTPCTPDVGDCGCDNCEGSFEDISNRMDDFTYRLWVDGWEREKAVWGVPQGFGQDTCVRSASSFADLDDICASYTATGRVNLRKPSLWCRGK